MDEIMRRLRDVLEPGDGPQLKNLGRLYSEEEVHAVLDEHVEMAENLGKVSGKDLIIWRVHTPSCLGFVEICVDDMTINQILFDSRPGGLWRPYCGGEMLTRVDLGALTRSIREIYAGGPEEWAKDPSFRPYR